MSVDAVVRRIAEQTAIELADFCARHRLSYANEVPHLAGCCKTATMRVASLMDPQPALTPFGFGDRHGWVGVGNVDVVLRWPDKPATFVELKCGAGKHTLRACVWDAVKLATAVLGENAAAGYLLAGAPTARWHQAIPGPNLFQNKEWETLGPAVRDDFIADWRKWEDEGHIPGRVPAGFRTVALGASHFTIAATPWELRLARVDPLDEKWIEWPSTLERV